MKESELKTSPDTLGRRRIWEQFNRDAGPFTDASRLANAEAARLALQASPDVKVIAWHQPNDELVCLLERRGTYVLFDRYSVDADDEHLHSVVVIGAPTLDDGLQMRRDIDATQADFADLWSDAE